MTKGIMPYLMGLLALALLFHIIRIVLKRRRIRKFMKEDGETDLNETFKNIALSMAKARSLYKKLIARVHPDRFEEQFKEEATELSTRITTFKRNYAELMKIQTEVDSFLEKTINKLNDSVP